MAKQIELTCQCNRIRKHMRSIVKTIRENDESLHIDGAYYIMNDLGKIADAIKKAESAGSDEYGNDELDAYNAIAQAIFDAISDKRH